MHHRCAEMLDQGGKTEGVNTNGVNPLYWDDFRFVLAIVRDRSRLPPNSAGSIMPR